MEPKFYCTTTLKNNMKKNACMTESRRVLSQFLQLLIFTHSVFVDAQIDSDEGGEKRYCGDIAPNNETELD